MAKKLQLAALAVASATVLAACATTSAPQGGGASASGNTITVGTTDKITSLDPAGMYDNGSFQALVQVYPFLVDVKPGATEPTPVPNIVTSAEFTSPNEYTVKLKDGLTFANGHKLTSSDVKFSFDRDVKIADENGPSSLLANLESVSAPDDSTVVFKLKQPNDQTFPQILGSPAGLIVDEEVFPADKILPDADIVKAKPFAGQYEIASYNPGELMSLTPFAGYKGEIGKVENGSVTVKYYADANNLRLDTENGAVDVAWRQLTATDVQSMAKNDKLKVVNGPGGEIRYMVFNFDTMPFGAKADGADPKKAQAVRAAVAHLVDRAAIAKDVYKDTYTPLYSYVPDGLATATPTLKDAYGDGSGKPDAEKAKKVLADAGVQVPVALNLQYNPDHYGKNSGDEYAAVKSQLEASGLFTVNLQSTEWVQYSKDRTNDVYPVYQLGWFPDISDPDNYLAPFFGKDNFVANHYENPTVQDLVAKEVATPDKAAREKMLVDIQKQVTADLPTLPLLQGSQIAVTGKDVSGVVLDGSFKLRYASIKK
ncbi:peptide/nickel transport system substrate-binding protein [Arcanobacterium wilhelmae]|uniref:Peptide/nickel transport system substrate-binding protein n=1 Tax=Arcanobacterium wilhelmae TaxID=1803177 RepID=A0ABT9NCU2_9ACTO|nr:ABC transporter substrate-binding protein [Arcanobacterium wilhelmae]MDP9801196.1 peptide/nickel transport system substrate-binding protein [Arcanobacterium wilhelmae]WFN90548.1 ABC transporter substrate-binding protein [Arcanobacterium wilhelmae]